MNEYASSVSLAVANSNAEEIDVDRMIDDLADHHLGAIAYGELPGLLEATLGIDAADPAEAGRIALRLVSAAARNAGADIVSLVAVETIALDEQERRLSEPVIPELVGLAEVATMLGVTKQRVGQLRDRPGFPSPVATLAAGPVWTKASLSRFVASWDRRPGRRMIDAATGVALGAAAAAVAAAVRNNLAS